MKDVKSKPSGVNVRENQHRESQREEEGEGETDREGGGEKMRDFFWSL